MWELYRRTFWRMQVLIGVVAGGVFAWRQAWGLALLFLIIMELSAVLGAAWGSRLRSKFGRDSEATLR